MNRGVVIIGSSNIDFVMKMERLPKLGETVTDAEFVQTFGGKGANQAVAVARSAAPDHKGKIFFVSCIGSDPAVPAMLKSWKMSGLNLAGLKRTKSALTGAALIMVGKAGENYLSVSPGSNYLLEPSDLERLRPILRRCGVAVFQNELKSGTTAAGLRLCHEEGVKTVFNFAPARELDREILRYVDILVVNETEADFLCGSAVTDADSARTAVEKLSEFGVGTVIITLGSAGCLIAGGGEVRSVPAYPVAAVDTTAAGDTFCGAFASALSESKALDECAAFASAAAAISVTRLGAQPSVPRRDEILAFLAGHPKT
jgi:ribokinase